MVKQYEELKKRDYLFIWQVPGPCENNLSLGQAKANEKPNEITAAPKLLEVLSLGDTVTAIDAMGRQAGMAGRTVDKKAGHILAAK